MVFYDQLKGSGSNPDSPARAGWGVVACPPEGHPEKASRTKTTEETRGCNKKDRSREIDLPKTVMNWRLVLLPTSRRWTSSVPTCASGSTDTMRGMLSDRAGHPDKEWVGGTARV